MGSRASGLSGLFADLLGFVIFFNIILAIFNLLPFSPLDGSKVLIGILPPGPAGALIRLEAAGPVVLLGIIMVDWVTDLNLLWGVLEPIVNVVGSIVVGACLLGCAAGSPGCAATLRSTGARRP